MAHEEDLAVFDIDLSGTNWVRRPGVDDVTDGTNADRGRCQGGYGEAPESDRCLHGLHETALLLPAAFPVA